MDFKTAETNPSPTHSKSNAIYVILVDGSVVRWPKTKIVFNRWWKKIFVFDWPWKKLQVILAQFKKKGLSKKTLLPLSLPRKTNGCCLSGSCFEVYFDVHLCWTSRLICKGACGCGIFALYWRPFGGLVLIFAFYQGCCLFGSNPRFYF